MRFPDHSDHPSIQNLAHPTYGTEFKTRDRMVLSRGDLQPRAQTAPRNRYSCARIADFGDLSRTDLYWLRFAAGRAPWANLVSMWIGRIL